MTDVRYNPKYGTPEQRIANRLKNSGGEEADHIVQQGQGPTRTFTNIHNPGSSRTHGVPGSDYDGDER